jgi:hypothetical protein
MNVCFMLECTINAPALCIEQLTDPSLVLVAAPDHRLAYHDHILLINLAKKLRYIRRPGAAIA